MVVSCEVKEEVPRDGLLANTRVLQEQTLLK